MNINYIINPSTLNPQDVFDLFQKAGTSQSNKTVDRISRSIKGSSVVATAWHNGRLIGYSNAISDFAWIGHISQLAVDPEYQGQGIGRNLIEKLQQELGDEVTLIVHSADKAKGFYRSIGFEEYNNMFKISRTR